MPQRIDPKEYEKALTEKLRYEFCPPLFEVVHNIRLKGRYSEILRQIDVAVRRAGEEHPFVIAEAKRHSRKVEIEYIEAFITRLYDIDIKFGIMAASSDFSAAGRRLAAALGIELLIMPIDEALEMNWRAVARQMFPLDWAFHSKMAAGLYRLQQGEQPQKVIDSLEELPYDEWEALVKYALTHHLLEAANLLWCISTHHYDDGWRFNAIQYLIDFGLLDKFDVSQLVATEYDPEIISLLGERGYL
jgi:hypothetical protein